MIEILHDVLYQIPKNYGSLISIGVVTSMTHKYALDHAGFSPSALPKGSCTTMVHTWVLKGIPVSLLWSLRIYYKATWTLLDYEK